MAGENIDFGNGDDVQDINNQNHSSDINDNNDQDKHDDADKHDDDQNNDKHDDADKHDDDNHDADKHDDDKNKIEVKAGDNIEFDGQTYTVAENGDILDKDGKVFKEQKDVAAWLESLQETEDEGISIDAIREAFPEDIVDEQGNPVEFENTTEGITKYINAIVENKIKGVEEAAINTLYANNPILKQFKDYVDVTGSYKGFGELPDREDWEIDKDNEAQQESIIRMAAQEFGNKTINNAYIQYLKDSGSLYNYAVEMLDALKEKDKDFREQVSQQAEESRKAHQEEVTQYWNKVNNIIKSKTIAGYKLPDSITKEVDGKKVILTPSDFFDYLSKQVHTNANGQKISAYQKDLEAISDDDYLNNELMNAWLVFTGGSFKDLANMAVKENEVRTLRLTSKQHKSPTTVRVNSKKPSKVNADDIQF